MTIELALIASYLTIGILAATIFRRKTLKSFAKGDGTSDTDIRVVAAYIGIGWLPLLFLTAYFILTWKDDDAMR